MTFGVKTYWRFKGERVWRIAWPQREDHGFIRMAPTNGTVVGGAIVSKADIEYKQ